MNLAGKTKMSKLAVIIIIEPGLLELQAKLLIASINRFLSPEKSLDIYTFSPRKNRKPSMQTMAYLKENVKHHHNEDLNIKYDHFPLANGLCASLFFEKTYQGYEHVLLTDTDTVFLNAMPKNLFSGPSVCVSPADNIGVGSTGQGDKNDAFWQQMFDFFDLKLPEVGMQTTVRKQLIRPYHNSGFVLVNQIPGFYSQWYKDFDDLMESAIRPDFVGRDGTNYGFFEQLVLSVTTARMPELVRYFPKSINYPIPFRPYLLANQDHINWNDLIHIHYHKWFQHPGFLEHVTNHEEHMSDTFKWLKEYLPLQPAISGPFKC